jgi:hypothetical protein
MPGCQACQAEVNHAGATAICKNRPLRQATIVGYGKAGRLRPAEVSFLIAGPGHAARHVCLAHMLGLLEGPFPKVSERFWRGHRKTWRRNTSGFRQGPRCTFIKADGEQCGHHAAHPRTSRARGWPQGYCAFHGKMVVAKRNGGARPGIGRPPANRRCQAHSKRHPGQQCRRWAAKGSRVCVIHGARGGAFGQFNKPNYGKARRQEIKRANSENWRRVRAERERRAANDMLPAHIGFKPQQPQPRSLYDEFAEHHARRSPRQWLPDYER